MDGVRRGAREITKGKLSDKLIKLPAMTGIEAAVNLITGVFQRRSEPDEEDRLASSSVR